tara:strand:+ start:3162 stop:3554 length:393 start_codon:yes stop_codon:yes gene_type:complete
MSVSFKKKWRDRCMDHPNIMFGQALRKARARAKKRDIPFEITKDYILSIFRSQNGRCYYSGLEMNIVKKDPDSLMDPMKMTIDLIDHRAGYIPGNVVWCAYCINSMKQRMTAEQVVSICESVVNNSSNIL